jgi:circadian clock protein KaiC
MEDSHDGFNGPPVSTGIAGLDDILRGGLTPSRLYLVEGPPGCGKTTLALQFLMAGARQGEKTLYVALSETKRELEAVAHSHGWSLDNVEIHELAPSEETLSPDAQLTMFHPSELELSETTKVVLTKVETSKPRRIVFDSLSEMRLMAQNPLRYRRQILGLKQFFVGRQSTVLLLDDLTGSGGDLQLHSIVHGVILLEHTMTDYGSERRRLTVRKMRGISFRGGMHDYLIRTGGLDVFPRLVASEHDQSGSDDEVSSGNAGLDHLLGSGLRSGSSTLLMGPAGIGKSSIALQFAIATAERGERASLFIFDETVGMLRSRARKLNLPLEQHLQSGMISVQQVDPAELSPGEFVSIIRRAVAGEDASGKKTKLVMIDSLNGYLHSMPEEKHLSAQLHELFTFLSHSGVSALVTVTQSGMVGTTMHGPVDTTYLADNVILFRYFEARGHVRRAISVVKKRSGAHEQTIREFQLSGRGIEVGEPLEGFQGILSGIPSFVGPTGDLLLKKEQSAPREEDNGR